MKKDYYTIGVTRQIGEDGRELQLYVDAIDGMDEEKVKKLAVRAYELIKEWEKDLNENKP